MDAAIYNVRASRSRVHRAVSSARVRSPRRAVGAFARERSLLRRLRLDGNYANDFYPHQRSRMKITDALKGEHGVFYAQFRFIEESLDGENLATLKALGAMLAAALAPHAHIEDESL